ncbi:amidohydrolase [Microbacterium mangrovi]|uniref:Amidohydrolase n=1 Tax=Microbacterium mangrovi TaxID=1348253 RepID=A0A0B2AE65_9MICO|nr:carbon-nitrogen hydrolase family protein [Microbacterium mangrovi]KHK99926.1 amidohydrolase [Microbacterium mangrovi]
MSLRIAAVQAEAQTGEVEQNVLKAAGYIRQAASELVDVIVIPEAFVTGYDDDAFAGPLPSSRELSWLAPVQQAVDETGMTVVLNTALARDDIRTLTDVVVFPGGFPVLAYDKQHLYESERTIFSPGNHGFSLAVSGMELGLSVCYDANFPEHAAAAAANNVSVYINSGAYFPGGEHRRDLHYAARALDNGMYVVFRGLVGGTKEFIGGSAIFDPAGRRIAHVPAREGLAVASIDPTVITRTRADQRMWTDRRANLGSYDRRGALPPISSSKARQG